MSKNRLQRGFNSWTFFCFLTLFYKWILLFIFYNVILKILFFYILMVFFWFIYFPTSVEGAGRTRRWGAALPCTSYFLAAMTVTVWAQLLDLSIAVFTTAAAVVTRGDLHGKTHNKLPGRLTVVDIFTDVSSSDLVYNVARHRGPQALRGLLVTLFLPNLVLMNLKREIDETKLKSTGITHERQIPGGWDSTWTHHLMFTVRGEPKKLC